MDPDALYEIHIDNNGDAREDLTYSFKFRNTTRGLALDIGDKNVAVPLANIGQITTGSVPSMNVVQSYTINQIRGSRRDAASPLGAVTPILGGTEFEKPQDNIGNKSIPNYSEYAGMHIRGVNIPGCTPPAGTFPRVFVGQRKEGFGVNLGEIFDLVNISVPKVIGARSGSGNATAYKKTSPPSRSNCRSRASPRRPNRSSASGRPPACRRTASARTRLRLTCRFRVWACRWSMKS